MSQRFDPLARKKIENYSYLLVDKIGAGYSSKVFKGREQSTLESCAIKVIDMQGLKNEVHRTLLLNQLQCLKDLKDSQFCIKLYDYYTTKNNTYIITQLCQEGDLAKLIGKGSIAQEKALNLMEDIVRGYLEMSQKNIVHRDIKPANIFIKDGRPKIADFGFSFRSQSKQPTKFNYNVGSPLYMSPQALGKNLYSFKSDVWALGIILFQMLNGKAPWTAKTQKQLAQKIKKQPISNMIERTLSEKSRQLIVGCLQVNLQSRLDRQGLHRWVKSIPKKDQIQAQQNICRVILSHINFSRFLYRLFSLLRKNDQSTGLSDFLMRFVYQLMSKVDELSRQYKAADDSIQLNKALKLIAFYKKKYKIGQEPQQLKEREEINYKTSMQTIINGIKGYRLIVQSITKRDQYFLAEEKDKIIILDYLVTALQLFSLYFQLQNNLGRFSKIVELQMILDGKPNRIFHLHLKQIYKKLGRLSL